MSVSRRSDRQTAPAVAMALGLALMVGAVGPAMGQAPDKPPETTPKPQKKDTVLTLPRAMATRAELEAIVAGQSGPVTPEELQVVRDRLTQGDLQPGDRIALKVLGEQGLSDTFTVRPTRTVVLPNLPEIPVDGVLRSELQGRLQQEIGKYIRNPQVDATALVRVSMAGAVARPGFYSLPADVLASDAIMAAGGPARNGDANKTEIRRGGLALATAPEVARALQEGTSLDKLNIQSGDEIIVGTQGEGVRGVLRTFGLISGAVFGIVAVSRIFK